MKHRLDPRTGTVILDPPKRPSAPKKRTVLARPVQDDVVTRLVQEMKELIVEELTKITVPPVTSFAPPQTSPSHSQSSVQIDESLIDVGIGQQEELIIGAGSATLKQEITEDSNLTESKNKLKTLKKG